MPKAKADKPLPLLEYIYLGVRVMSTGKQARALLLLDADGKPEDDERWFAGNKLRGIVGGVYTVPGERKPGGGMSAVLQDAQFKCEWHDDEARVAWAARDASERGALARRKHERSMGNAMHVALEPIRRQYRLAVGDKRAALLAEVVRYICSDGAR